MRPRTGGAVPPVPAEVEETGRVLAPPAGGGPIEPNPFVQLNRRDEWGRNTSWGELTSAPPRPPASRDARHAPQARRRPFDRAETVRPIEPTVIGPVTGSAVDFAIEPW